MRNQPSLYKKIPAFISLMLLCISHYAQLPDKGLLVYFPFNNSLKDCSGNNNDPYSSNNFTPTSDRFGNANAAYYFNGASFVTIPHSLGLQTPVNSFALACWIKVESKANKNDLEIPLLSKGGSVGTKAQYRFVLTRIFGDSYSMISLSSDFNGRDNGYSTHAIDFDKWYFVTVTLDEGWVFLYINGKLVWQSINTKSFIKNENDLEIGRDVSTGKYFKGALDDLRIYNRALSDAEIQKLFTDESSKTISAVAIAELPVKQEEKPLPVSPTKTDAPISVPVRQGSASTTTSSVLTEETKPEPNTVYKPAKALPSESEKEDLIKKMREARLQAEKLTEQNRSESVGIIKSESKTADAENKPEINKKTTTAEWPDSSPQNKTIKESKPSVQPIEKNAALNNEEVSLKTDSVVTQKKEYKPAVAVITNPETKLDTLSKKQTQMVTAKLPTSVIKETKTSKSSVTKSNATNNIPPTVVAKENKPVTEIQQEDIRTTLQKMEAARLAFEKSEQERMAAEHVEKEQTKAVAKETSPPLANTEPKSATNTELTSKIIDKTQSVTSVPQQETKTSSVRVEAARTLFDHAEQAPKSVAAEKTEDKPVASNSSLKKPETADPKKEEVKVVAEIKTPASKAKDNTSRFWTFVCPQPIVRKNEDGKCGAIVKYTAPQPEGISLKPVQSKGLQSGQFFPIGTTTNSFYATDDSGQKKSCSFNVTVKDEESPVFNCPNDTILYLPRGRRGLIYHYTPPAATDNCTIDSIVQTLGSKDGCFLEVGVHPFTFKAIDHQGNFQLCTYSIMVREDPNSKITAPPVAIEEDLALGNDTIHYEHQAKVNNCDLTIYIYDDGEEDNDSVSIIFNGEVIVNRQMIRLKETGVIKRKISLMPDQENYLVAKAWNTGRYGLNTLRIDVYEGTVENDKRDLKNVKPSTSKVLHSKPGTAGGLLLKCQ